MTKYQVTKAPNFLYSVGISYHATGTLSDNTGAKVFDYYKADRVTAEQADTIRAWCPDVKFGCAVSEYAPELETVAICFPKSAYYKKPEATESEQAGA